MLKSHWDALPFVRIAALIASGIIAARLLPFGALYAAMFATAVAGYLYLHGKVLRNPSGTTWQYTLTTVCAYAALFSFGALRLWQTEPREQMSPYAADSTVTAYQARIISRADRKVKGNSTLTAEIVQVRTPKGWQPARARVQLTLRADSLQHQKLLYGSRLLIGGKPQIIEPPKNPDAFDYRQLMRNKGIVYQHFVRQENWQPIADAPAFSLRGTALQLQQWADRTLERAIGSPTEAGLAAALVIGLKDDLDDRLLQAYSATGIMHVLAVSGLHVGILFTLLSLLLRPLQHHERGRLLFSAVVLAVLWSYALITGLSPSVMRATLMFSLFSIAQLFDRRGSSFNTLAVSAVILLAYDPLMLFQVGFQLSYAAVAGIMYFYPRFYGLWKAPDLPLGIADKIWSILCVSAAAQLATFPLGMYYFHQFPNYFLLANLFAVPLAFCILSGGIIVLLLSWQPLLAQWSGTALKWLIRLNNYIAFRIEELPYAATKALYISGWELLCIYGIILTLSVYVALRHRLWLAGAVLCAAAFSTSKLWSWYQHQQERLLAVFHTARHSSVLWLAHRHGLLLADSALLAQPQQIRYNFADFLVKRGIDWEQMPTALLSSKDSPIAARQIGGGTMYRKEGLQIFCLREPLGQPALPPCDLLMIGHNAVYSLQVFPRADLRRIRCLVLEGSNSPKTIRRLQEEARTMGIRCHAVATDGAFVWHY